jgi:rubrerythrin
MNYDSTQETLAHIRRVQSLLADVQANLTKRAIAHDTSKLEEPEKSGFDKVTGALKGLTYGSDEYKAQLRELQPILRHHYENNTHHPEHFAWYCAVCGTSFSAKQAPEQERVAGVDGDTHRFCPLCCARGSVIWEAELDYKPEKGVSGMTLLDVIEMLCDWKAAGERHADGSITKSLEINKKRFGISDQLASILDNTRKELGWEG